MDFGSKDENKNFCVKITIKFNLCRFKTKMSCKTQNHSILAKNMKKTWNFDKTTAFDENHSFHDFCVSVIFYGR